MSIVKSYGGAITLSELLDSDCVMMHCIVDMLNDEVDVNNQANKEAEAKRIINELRGGHG